MTLSVSINRMQIRDNSTFAMIPPAAINNYKLAANTPVNIFISDLGDENGLVPNVLSFACDANFFVGWNKEDVVVPAAHITNGEGLELDPGVRKIGANITKFSVVSASNCQLQIGLFVLEN